MIHNSLARKRTGDAEIGWRPTPEKDIETVPFWGKKIAQRIALWTWDVTHERALVPPTCSEERRQLEPQLAFWSEFASAYAAQVHYLCASVTAMYLPYLVLGEF